MIRNCENSKLSVSQVIVAQLPKKMEIHIKYFLLSLLLLSQQIP